jgi:glycosyltransferase involved in cell wall biosynthesis
MTTAIRPWASVVIPIKDERDNLLPLTEQLLDVMASAPRSGPFEILYVDDGSTDGSRAVLDSLSMAHNEVKVFHFDRNYGQTSAFAAGFRHASGELIITMDGDLQFDPADILTLLPFSAKFDLVCGWRKDRHDSFTKKLSSRFANAVRSRITGDRIHDTGCSLKIFRRAIIERIQLFEGMHRFFPALALMHGFTVTEIPVRHYPRKHGVSKYGVGNRLFKGLYDLIAVRWMQSRCLQYEEGPSTTERWQFLQTRHIEATSVVAQTMPIANQFQYASREPDTQYQCQ